VNSNLSTVKAMYEAFGRGDIAALLEQVSEEVQWECWSDNLAQKAGVPWLQPRQGKAGVGDFFSLIGTFEIREFSVLSLMDGGDKVAAEFVIEALPPGGRLYRDEEIHLWTFNPAGKVVGLRHYTDTAKHIAAAQRG
jgi:ketosteroid isomerase-like protein